ncbi:MAG: hypothetical protein AB8B59_01785 [Maribacter sp.]
MKKVVILIASFLMTTALLAQENTNTINQGTILILGSTNAHGYQHIDLPRKNTIIKRGAIADYNNLEGCQVLVTEVHTRSSGTEIVLKRKDGLNFFRFFPTVKANFEKAVVKGELILIEPQKEDSIAQR